VSVGLELNKVIVPVEAMGQALAQRQAQDEDYLARARIALEQHAPVSEELRRKISLAGEVDASWRGAVPLGERLDERHPSAPDPAPATLIAVDGSQIYPDRHGIAPYYLINIGSITLRQGSGSAPSTGSQPSLFFAQEELYDEKGRLRNVEHVNRERDRREIETLAGLAEDERGALGGKFTRPVLALVDGPLLFWAPSQTADPEGRNETRRQIEHFTRQLSRLRGVRAAPIGYIDRPSSANVLRTLELADLAPNGISRESVRTRRYGPLVDRMLFAHLGPGERSALFASTALLNAEYADAGHRIVFFYVNMARQEGEDNAIIARVELPEWAVQDPQGLEPIVGALYADCEMTGLPYVLVRAHELAVVTNVERAEFEKLLGQQMIRRGLSPQVSAKAAGKRVTAGKSPGRSSGSGSGR
jgi:NurA domain